MRLKLIVIIVIACMVVPCISHAFGLFRWAWDGAANQLGFDRGPVPKAIPKFCRPHFDPRDNRRQIYDRYPAFYIQADGF